jgi:hypothetical protein
MLRCERSEPRSIIPAEPRLRGFAGAKHLRIRGAAGSSAIVIPDLIRNPDLPLTLMLRCERSEPRSTIQLEPSFEALLAQSTSG